MPQGAYRRVVFIGNLVFKFPRLASLPSGMRCNRWEREVWSKWRPIFSWVALCPVLYADPFGFVLVMPKAEQSVTQDEINSLSEYPDNDAEPKPESYGRLPVGVVAFDYGLSDAEDVQKRRAYYAECASHRNA